MAYDSTKDKTLWEEALSVDDENEIRVVVMQYNGGEPKIQLNRMEGKGFRKFGRMTADECVRLLPLLTRAAKAIKEKAFLPEHLR